MDYPRWMMDVTVIAESTPGPIAINCATFVGYRQAGLAGSLAATAGIVIPSFVLIFHTVLTPFSTSAELCLPLAILKCILMFPEKLIKVPHIRKFCPRFFFQLGIHIIDFCIERSQHEWRMRGNDKLAA